MATPSCFLKVKYEFVYVTHVLTYKYPDPSVHLYEYNANQSV